MLELLGLVKVGNFLKGLSFETIITIIFSLVAIIALVYAGYTLGHEIYDKGKDWQKTTDAVVIDGLNKQITELKDASSAAIQANLDLLRDSNAKILEAKQNAQVEIDKQKARAAASAAAADSLRKTTDSANAKLREFASREPTCSAAVEYASAATTVVNECISEYRTVGELAKGYQIDDAMIRQAWITNLKPAS